MCAKHDKMIADVPSKKQYPQVNGRLGKDKFIQQDTCHLNTSSKEYWCPSNPPFLVTRAVKDVILRILLDLEGFDCRRFISVDVLNSWSS